GSADRNAEAPPAGGARRRDRAHGNTARLPDPPVGPARPRSARKPNRLMRTLVHLSDLHFGRVDPAILAPLLKFIGEIKPDLVAVSGDLTQRARTVEYTAAQEFL